MSYQNPWELYPKIWKTKSEFFVWLRGNLRRAVWETYPPKIQFKNENCLPPPSDYVGRARSGTRCALSGAWTSKSMLEVDHIVGNASLKDWDDLLSFVQHLCANSENLQLVSKEAHRIKSYAERQGISYEDAVIEKQAIAIVKNKKDKEFFIERGMTVPTNAKLRREGIVSVLRGEF